MQNRDHYRAMMKFPAETHEESIKRTYTKWPPPPPTGFEEKTIVHHMLNLEMTAIDLYVVLSPKPLKWSFTISGGEKIGCAS